MIPDRAGRVALVLLPGLAIAAVAVADQAVGQSVILGLVVVAPLLAANVADPRVTAGYGVLAFLTVVLLGIADGVYVPGDALLGQGSGSR